MQRLRSRVLVVLGAGWGALVVSASVLPGCAKPERAVPPGPSVLLVSIDSLRADFLGTYGRPVGLSPVLDRLARDGAIFPITVSSTSWTLPAHASLLTSLYNPVHRVAYGSPLDPARITLAEELQAAGYRTAAFVTGPWMNRSFGLSQGFETYRNTSVLENRSFRDGDPTRPIPEAHLASHSEETGEEIAARAVAWLDENGDRPFFLFLHFWDVHYDYEPPPPFDTLFDPDYRGSVDGRDFIANQEIRAGMDPRDLQHVRALYEGEIRFTDRNLGRVIAHLEAQGLLDRTLVVVTADHGDEFFEHGLKGHNQSLYDEVVLVPLVLRWPQGVPRGAVAPGMARLIDVYPTILDLLGLAPGREAMGRSLRGAIEGEPEGDTTAFCDLFLLREHRYEALRTPNAKAIRKIEDDLTRHAVFDLLRDPRERSALNGPPGSPPALLQGDLDAASRRLERLGDALPGQGGAPVRLREDEERLLRELGYIR